ncbi:antibiotic biosynthesis monooxygenase [Diaporthe sp. PMI_573]|nr:antibiotic biosynthesis monooxygenase [Diaporthaceae sp. PMI_573]
MSNSVNPVTTLDFDPATPLPKQLDSPDTGPVVLLNNFLVPSGRLDEAIVVWQKTAEALKKEPGYISAQLHRGIGGANIMVNYAVWENAETLKAALGTKEFVAALSEFPKGTTMRPCVLHKLAIPNICVPY